MTKVFISWSGDHSKQIGEAIRDWLPGVLQLVRPYFTPTDIEKGARWADEIKKELSDSKLGIFIVTRENINSSWLHFEAGAISNSIDKSAVCPLLFDLEPTDLSGPLSQFQATKFNKTEAQKLITNLNEKIGDHKLAPATLNSVFEKWWPDLEKSLSKIKKPTAPSNDEIRSERDMIEEILSRVRAPQSNSRDSITQEAAGEAAITILMNVKDFIFTKFSGVKTTERQIKIINAIDVDVAFELDLDKSTQNKISSILRDGRSILEAHLKTQKNPQDDDDIPF